MEKEINGINYRLNEETLTAEVIKKSGGYEGDIAIPETVVFDERTYRVTSIGVLAFLGCSLLSDITIPDGVTSIGDLAFEDCKSLKSITIPDSLKSIGKEAFYSCKSLKYFHYRGTIAQWKEITLARDSFEAWNRRSIINVVRCIDGNVVLY